MTLAGYRKVGGFQSPYNSHSQKLKDRNRVSLYAVEFQTPRELSTDPKCRAGFQKGVEGVIELYSYQSSFDGM